MSERLEELRLELAQTLGIIGTLVRRHPRNTTGSAGASQVPNVAKYGIRGHTDDVPDEMKPAVADSKASPVDAEDSSKLAELLEEAKAASPQERIAWRDRIASYNELAIAGVAPWLADSTLAAFAIRVIWTVGEHGSPEEATRALRSARPRLSPALQGDVDWAIASLKTAQKRDAAKPAQPAAEPTQIARTREAPRMSTTTRRRSS
jgi:hypothetical protein